MTDAVPPSYVIGTAAVSAMMVATSVAISLTTEGDVADLLYLDCLATQNLGHAAFLVGFATSYWRGGHVLGKCFVVTAPWLLAAHGAASLAAAGPRPLVVAFVAVAVAAAAAAPSLAAVAAGPASGSRAAAATRWAAIGVSLAYALAALAAAARDARAAPASGAALPEPALHAAALPEPALYAEGYTLAFHVAFVSAVGLACADALERGAAADAVIYGVGFVSASATTAATLAVDALAAPAPVFYAAGAGVWAAAAAGAAAALSGGRPEPAAPAAPAPARGPVVDLAALAAAAVPGAAAAWPLAVAHGATFVGQALLVAVAADPPGSRFDRGVNFAIHGAGIFVFNAYLMFSDARAFPRLRAISVFACFAGGAGAARTAAGLAAGAPAPLRRAAAALFAARAAVGAALGVALARLPRDAHDRVAPPVKAPDREAPRTVWKSTTGLGGPHQTSELSISANSKSIRLIFGRIDCSRRVLEAKLKSLVQTVRLRAH